MRILLTNDDGVRAVGLKALADALVRVGEVIVAAPDRERSATGHAITIGQPIFVEKIPAELGMNGWMIGGTPADCVKLAVSRLLERPPDLVVSGINRGANLGTDVLYSGTVSAAVEGVIMGVPSIAVSLTSFDREADYSFPARYTAGLVRALMRKGMEKDVLININIPPVSREELKGVRITRLGARRYENLFEEQRDPSGRTAYFLGGDVIEEEQAPDSDVVAVDNGYVSVTPIHFDLTDYRLLIEYRNKFRHYVNGGGRKR